MFNTDIAEVLKDTQKVFEVSEKMSYGHKLVDEEKDIAESFDAWAREIGKKGRDNDCEISEFIRKTVQEEVYDAPDELLDLMFTRGSIGEFDDTLIDVEGKNTLIAYESGNGGTVDKSYLDFKQVAPSYKKHQIDTQLSYVDLRKNGFKSIANVTTYAKEALQNKMFNDVFSQIDSLLVAGSQVFTATGTLPTTAEMDALELYCTNRDDNALAVGLSNYIKAVGKMNGYKDYFSENMKDQFNRYGIIPYYQGLKLASISNAKTQGDGSLLLPSKRIFGIAGKIGNLDMRGELRVTQTMDNANDRVNIYVKDFEYGLAITKLENVAKIVLQ